MTASLSLFGLTKKLLHLMHNNSIYIGRSILWKNVTAAVALHLVSAIVAANNILRCSARIISGRGLPDPNVGRGFRLS